MINITVSLVCEKKVIAEEVQALHTITEDIQASPIALNNEQVSNIFFRSIDLHQKIQALLEKAPNDLECQGLETLSTKVHQAIIKHIASYWICPTLYNPNIGNLIFKELPLSCLATCASINKQWKEMITQFFSEIDVEQCQTLCGSHLSILDRKKLMFLNEVIEPMMIEPKVNCYELLKEVISLHPQIKGDKGLTLLTVPKGLTINKLIETASKNGVTVNKISEKFIPQKYRDVAEIETYRILISNHIMKKTLDKIGQEQENELAKHGWEMPTLLEYILLYVGTQIVYNKHLFSGGQDKKLVAAQSSTQINNKNLCLFSLNSCEIAITPPCDVLWIGAGSQKKL